MGYGVTVDETGIHADTFADTLAKVQGDYRQIYGDDIYIEPDSQDGQFLALIARAIKDCNDSAVAAFNSFRPEYAIGIGLSSVVKINNIKRHVPSNSQVSLTIVGVAGTIITNGSVTDTGGNAWFLPASVVIPVGGEIVENAVCGTPGAINAAPNTVTNIAAPVPGWQTVTNVLAAIPGNPVESDGKLRRRQSKSTQIPAVTKLEAIEGALADLTGVIKVRVYENSSGTPDGNGLPAHAISAVVFGGDTLEIARTIAANKVGNPTYGDTSETIIDNFGVPETISFFTGNFTTVYVKVTLQALNGYVSTTGNLIKKAIGAFIGGLFDPDVPGLDIGEEVYVNRLYGPANLRGDEAIAASGLVAATPLTQSQLDALSKTYNVTDIQIGTSPGVYSHSDISIAFNRNAFADDSDITLVVS